MLCSLISMACSSIPLLRWRESGIAGLSKHGLDPDSVVQMAHGRPSRTTIRELLPNSDVALEDREVERREIEDLDGVALLPGARQLLSALPPNRWTIATSCTRPLAEVRLRAAGLPIPETMITSSDVKIGKPDPEPYQKAAAKLGFPASECIVVEDAPAGVHAGKVLAPASSPCSPPCPAPSSKTPPLTG